MPIMILKEMIVKNERNERSCPVCGSKKYKMEKCMDGYTTCLNCGRHEKNSEFYNEELENNILYTDDYDDNKKIIEHSKYIEVMGGDGTLLKAINRFRQLNKPFFGVAAGTVNFLMNQEEEISEKAMYKKFNLIKVKVTYLTPNIFGDLKEKTEEFQAFNDVMIGGNMNSWIDFKVKEKDCIFGDFKGGGLIISTPQGSTGINKNNNGVVLPLSSKMWSITGDKTNRKIEYVIKPTYAKIDVNSRTEVNVWVDGENHFVENVSTVEISKGSTVEVIFNDYSAFKKKRRL